MNLYKLLPLAFCAVLTFSSCDDDDDDATLNIPAVVENNFSQRYPDATAVSWEKENEPEGAFLKAEFKKNGAEVEVWYQFDGTWVKTETEFFGALPEAVTAYLKANYPDYLVEDAKWVETPTQNYYEIDLDKGKEELELSIKEDGTFIQVVPDLD